MAYESFDTLTSLEIIALASYYFPDDSFVPDKVAALLCSVMRTKFLYGHVAIVRKGINDAVAAGIVATVHGPRGGARFQMTEYGIQAISQVELPLVHIEQERKRRESSNEPAQENIGPIFDQIRKHIPQAETDAHNFVTDIETHWMNKGRVSAAQVASLADTAQRFGFYFNRNHYIGRAHDDWYKPYAELRREQDAAEKRAVMLRYEERRRQLDEEYARQRRAENHNKQVAVKLRSPEYEAIMSNLASIVTEVFPGTTVSKGTITSAYSGRGSAKLRVCVSALAFNLPPAEVWASSDRQAQPDSSSNLWIQMTSSEAYRVILKKFDKPAE